MTWLTFKIKRRPGFRINLTDLGFLLLLGGIAAGLRALLPETSEWLIPSYVGFTFFLFCNVFRIGNRLEAFWYVPFVFVAVYGILTMNMSTFWLLAICLLEPLKLALIVYRIRKGPYRGILYQKIGNYAHQDAANEL